MAEIPYTISNQLATRGVLVVTWTGLGRGQDGTPFQPKSYALSDRSFHVFGDFDSAVMYIVGSNEISSPSNFVQLRDPSSNVLTFTTAALKQVLETCAWIRPSVGGSGGNTNLTAILFLKARSI